MNTLIFIAGMGSGSFVTVLVSMWLVGRMNKNSTDRQAKFNQVTEELMRERNGLDIIRNQQLITIKQSIDTASRAIDTWVDNNWKGGRK